MHLCPGEETVGAFVAGRLALPVRQEMEGHLDRCPTCQQLVVRLLSRLPEPAGASVAVPAEHRCPTLLARGQKLGRYVLLTGAGTGGMGTVYAAYDTLLDRKVALKFLIRSGTTQAVLAEASAMARLSHPNVVKVHDVGVLEGLPYLSMELVEGVTLAVWRRQQPRTVREIARVMAAAARGLAAAHEAGIVHRDVKPHNILVAPPRVLVTDFGLSVRRAGEAEGVVAGTPAYMAPEQFRGERVDARTDVFGLCATLFEMLHGQPPFSGISLGEVRAQVENGRVTPQPIRSRAAARLHRLALRGLAPEPARRPAGMNEVAEALLADPAARWRNGVLAAAAATAVVAAFWGGGQLKGSPERECRARAGAVASLLDDAHRAEIAERYRGVGLAARWPALQARLDQYAAGWRTMYGETCGATYGKRVQSDAVFALRVACLDVQRVTFQALLDGLRGATPAQLDRAAEAPLPEVADCGISGRQDTRPLPSDRARTAAIEEALGRSRAQQILGDERRAAVHAEEAVRAARQLGHEPLLAAALGQRAAVELEAPAAEQPAALERAARLYEEAFAVAEAGRDDRQRLAAARAQVLVHNRRREYGEAQLWTRVADALGARLGGGTP
jgi:hypothetical protein